MRIEAFRGYRFGIDRGRDVSEVVAPPYDQISPEMQERLYAMHPNNIVRVSYPRDQAGRRRDRRQVPARRRDARSVAPRGRVGAG